ncbi:MAG: alpha/beta hydrolase [Myxococcales bacterium]|nr:alpha/beta hydrolase [Myxococcales bacterium]
MPSHAPVRITAPDGATVAYRRRGEGPAMLIHNGLLSTELHWRYWVQHFRRRFSVITWDYRGHGASPRPADLATVGITGYADDAHAVLGAVPDLARPAIVCGLSMGVQTALEHYRRHPGDMRALVLICGTWGHPLGRVSSSEKLRRALIAAVRMGARGGALFQAALWPFLRTPLGRELSYLAGGAHRRDCPKDLLDELFAHIAKMDPGVMTAAVSSYLDHTAEEVLETIRVPTLIIAGGKDQLTPPSLSRTMQRRIAGSVLHVIEGHTHLAQVEVPERIHAVADEFLARLG